MIIPPFLIPIGVGIIAQLSKPIFNRKWWRDQINRSDPLPQYGGMPSAHTAFATSLATIVGLTDGIYTASFAVAVGVLIFILDDALRLRVFLGRFGVAIRRLLQLIPEEDRKSLPHIEGRIGHTAPEVLVGAIIGIIVTVLIWTVNQ